MLKFLIVKFSIIGLLIIGYTSWKDNQENAAQAYFDARCKDAGEFIYRTVENVEGVFQMRAREQGDYFSRLRKGELMEDPYGHTNKEAKRPWHLFLRYPKDNQPTYSFFESVVGPDVKKYDLGIYRNTFIDRPIYTNESYWLYEYHSLVKSKKGNSYGTTLSAKQTSTLKSQYGFTWREVQTEEDKKFGVIGGELIVKELATNETLGVRKGFFSGLLSLKKPEFVLKKNITT